MRSSFVLPKSSKMHKQSQLVHSRGPLAVRSLARGAAHFLCSFQRPSNVMHTAALPCRSPGPGGGTRGLLGCQVKVARREGERARVTGCLAAASRVLGACRQPELTVVIIWGGRGGRGGRRNGGRRGGRW